MSTLSLQTTQSLTSKLTIEDLENYWYKLELFLDNYDKIIKPIHYEQIYLKINEFSDYINPKEYHEFLHSKRHYWDMIISRKNMEPLDQLLDNIQECLAEMSKDETFGVRGDASPDCPSLDLEVKLGDLEYLFLHQLINQFQFNDGKIIDYIKLIRSQPPRYELENKEQQANYDFQVSYRVELLEDFYLDHLKHAESVWDEVDNFISDDTFTIDQDITKIPIDESMEVLAKHVDNLDQNHKDELIKYLRREYADVCSNGDVLMHKWITQLENNNELSAPNNDYSTGVFRYLETDIYSWYPGKEADPFWAS